MNLCHEPFPKESDLLLGHMLYFRVVTLSYSSRNRRKEEKIGGSQFAVSY